MELIIGNKNYSSWSLRPWVFMKYFQIEFEEKRVPLFTENTDKELLQYGSDCKVPVLQDGGMIIWDSLSILEYLSEKYLESAGWPEEEAARALARSISAEMHSSFFYIRNEMPMNCRKKFHDVSLSTEARREVDRVINLWRRCRNSYGDKGEWLFGKYSIADAMFAPVALRFEGYSLPLEGIEKQYTDNVLNMACIKEWIEAGKSETEVIGEDEINA